MTNPPRHVTVVGAGITGLLTAAHLADAGVSTTVLEAADDVGGQVRSLAFEGATVDVGAESLHTATPGVLDLLRRLGLETQVVDARRGCTWIAAGARLRRLPDGMGPTGPSRLWPVATSRILSPTGLLRAACEPFVPGSAPERDVAVGTYLAGRFGMQLTERLLDPLLGNLHAGDVHRLSLAAATPMLDRAARRHRSLVVGRQRGATGPPPRFVSLEGGLGRIAEALAADRRISVRLGAGVSGVESTAAGYRVLGGDATLTETDAVVLAVPSAVAARLIAPLDVRAGQLLEGLESATVATVVAAYRRADVARHDAFEATGLLVPSSAGRVLKAATFLSRKWPHLDTGAFLVRMSVGRAGEQHLDTMTDAELVQRLHADLAELTGLDAAPITSLVHRWPHTMPQLLVGHHQTIATVRQRLDVRHRVQLAGAAYDGVGIGSCLRSAEDVVRRLLGSRATAERVA